MLKWNPPLKIPVGLISTQAMNTNHWKINCSPNIPAADGPLPSFMISGSAEAMAKALDTFAEALAEAG